MRIRMLIQATPPLPNVAAGECLDVPGELGEQLIADGRAEAVEQAAPPAAPAAVETATAEPPEVAAHVERPRRSRRVTGGGE